MKPNVLLAGIAAVCLGAAAGSVALAGEEAEPGKEGPVYPEATESEAREIRQLLARIPMPAALKRALHPEEKEAEKELEPETLRFIRDHADTDAERKTLEKRLTAMTGEERKKYIEEKTKEQKEKLEEMSEEERKDYFKKKEEEREKKRKEEERKKRFESEAFASEGVGPADMTDEEFREHYEKAKERLKKQREKEQALYRRHRDFVKQRNEAVAALEAYGPKATPFLADALRKADLDAGRILVGIAASIRNDPRAHDAILAWLDRQKFDRYLKGHDFLFTIARMNIEGIVPALERALDRTHTRNKGFFFGGLMIAKNYENASEVAGVLLRFLEKKDPVWTEAALNNLVRFLPDRNVPGKTKGEIIRAFDKLVWNPRYRNVAPEITAALGRSGHEDAVGLLERLLEHRNDRVRQNALRSLGLLGKKAEETVGSVVKFLDDRHATRIRMEAAEALGRIQNKEAVWPLIDVLYERNIDLEFRQRLARALRRITGKNLGVNARRWENWWAANENR